MKWNMITLGECCTSITDGDHQSMPVSETGIPFIIISNIRNNTIDFSNTRYVPLSYYDSLDQSRKPQPGDIIYTVKGSFGIPVYVNADFPFTFQRDIAILKCNNSIDSQYLFQVMRSSWFYKIADQLAIGSAQRAITLKTLRNMQIPVPNIVIQRKIASILSAYDTLIENNQKQIKLLEEAAQRLYQEWFVKLRFPGHEKVKIVDGVPEGWKRVSVTDLLQIKYGKDHKKLKNGPIPVYGSGGIMRKVEPVLYSGESVLIPRKGSLNNILYVTGDFWTIDTMFYSVPTRNNVVKYVYLFLLGLDMYSFNIGAAVPSMTVKILDGIYLLLPCDEVLHEFERTVNPLFERTMLLSAQNEVLAEARDRLLPKLMSGEIEV